MQTMNEIAKDIIQKFISSQELQADSPFVLLIGDASSRQYYRYSDKSSNQTYILTRYPGVSSKASLERYIYWQNAYEKAHLLVPKTLGFDLAKQLLVQEDVGTIALQNNLGSSSIDNEKQKLLEAVSLLPKIRKLAVDTGLNDYASTFGTMPSFNLEKLQFEINHTLKYFIGLYLEKEKEIATLQKLWTPLLQRIANLPKHLCHRDYHSRNLMCWKDKLYVIDFQDSMMGPVEYDLCSLLDDCYIKYQPASYQYVMRSFFDQALSDKVIDKSYEEFFINYHLVKLQRQFKAIGSFCYVWSDKNNVKYLKYISYVMESIKSSFEVLNLPELAALKEKVLTLYYEH